MSRWSSRITNLLSPVVDAHGDFQGAASIQHFSLNRGCSSVLFAMDNCGAGGQGLRYGQHLTGVGLRGRTLPYDVTDWKWGSGLLAYRLLVTDLPTTGN